MGSFPSRCRRVKTFYRVLIVRPLGEFKPTNWRQSPNSYEFVRTHIADTQLLGKPDAFRFVHNKGLIDSGDSITEWAILETSTVHVACSCRQSHAA
jgi:hypothetical protein